MINKIVDFFGVFIGFRKFSIMLIIFVVSVLLLLFKILDGAEWVDLLKPIAVAYFATNSIEHFTTMAKAWIQNAKTTLEKDDVK